MHQVHASHQLLRDFWLFSSPFTNGTVSQCLKNIQKVSSLLTLRAKRATIFLENIWIFAPKITYFCTILYHFFNIFFDYFEPFSTFLDTFGPFWIIYLGPFDTNFGPFLDHFWRENLNPFMQYIENETFLCNFQPLCMFVHFVQKWKKVLLLRRNLWILQSLFCWFFCRCGNWSFEQWQHVWQFRSLEWAKYKSPSSFYSFFVNEQKRRHWHWWIIWREGKDAFRTFQ